MSTRACFVIQDPQFCLLVYKRDDGYPSGAIDSISSAKSLAWALPRFEAGEWAAAFAAANKPTVDLASPFSAVGGGVHFFGSVDPKKWKESNLIPGDIEYLYHIEAKKNPENKSPFNQFLPPIVTAYAVRERGESLSFKKLFSYPLAEVPTQEQVNEWDRQVGMRV